MIKIATEADIPRIKELSSNFFYASPYKDLVLEEEKQNQLIHDLIEKYPYEGIILCLWKNDVIIGVLAGALTEVLFSYVKIASEIIWWVEPEYRGSKESISLLSAFEWWADRVAGAGIGQMVALEDENIDTVSKFYRRKGYHPVERGFIKHFGRN